MQIARRLGCLLFLVPGFAISLGALDLFFGTPAAPCPLGVAAIEQAKPFLDRRPFRIAVVADVQKGMTTFLDTLEALRDEPLVLAVSTGDLLAHGEEAYLRLVLWQLGRARWTKPFVAVPGNHDKEPEARYFEAAFGGLPPCAAGTEAGLVFVDNALAPPAPEVWDALAAAWGDARPRRAFVFLHRPPTREPQPKDAPPPAELAPEYARLREILAGVPEVLLFCGHGRGYHEVALAPGWTLYANGDGSDYDGDLPTGMAKTLLVEIDEAGKLSVTSVALPRRRAFPDLLFHFVCAKFVPWAFLGWGLVPMFVLPLAGAIWLRRGRA